MNNQPNLTTEEWLPDHPDWPQLASLIAELGQSNWVAFEAAWHLSSHLLVAHQAGEPIGFLRYVIQEIGVEEDQPAVTLQGKKLTEAKVIAFGVASKHRRLGIGRLLQEKLIEQGKAKGCYQIRSHSSASNQANHQLKLSMGFAMHPLINDGKKDGAYFLLPLSSREDSLDQPVINLANDKVALGPLRHDLLSLYLKWYNDFEVMEHYLIQLRPRTLEIQTDMHERNARGGPSTADFTIYERTTMRPIGLTNLDNIDDVNLAADFNIFIGEKACWGKGYGTATTVLMLDYGFTLLGLHNIMLKVDSHNERAIRAFRRAGFKEIGRRRQVRKRGNQVYDQIYMDCLATEFESPALYKSQLPSC